MATLTKSERPKIQLQLQSFDYVLEVIAGLGVMALMGLAVFYYNQLPEQIPRHYDFAGRPDALGGKMILWLLPTLGLIIYGLLTFMNRIPHLFNYPMKITAENAATQYFMATRLIRVLKAFIMLLFAYLVWRTIGIAQNEASGLGAWLLPVVVLVNLGLVFSYIYRSSSKK